MEAHAEYNFNSRADDEITFKTGDLLLVTDIREDDDWFLAVLNASEGFVPKNYIKFIIPCWFWKGIGRIDAEDLLTNKGTHIGTFCIRKSESYHGAYSLSVRSSKETVQHFKILTDDDYQFYIWLKKFRSLDALVDYYRSNSVTTNSKLLLRDPRIKVKRCRALFDFTPVDHGQLGFKKGQKIRITDDSDANWWKGCLRDGKKGTFPSNYVCVID